MTSLRNSFAVTFVLTVLFFSAAPINLQSGGGIMGILSVQPANGQSSTAKTFVVIVSSAGFNGSDSSLLHIAVNQGDLVQITFIMDVNERNDTSPENHHILEITGYGLRTEDINPSHPKSTVTFLADQLGTFTIRCSGDTSECPGHYGLQDGMLEVKNETQTTTSTTTTRSTTSSASTATSGSTTTTTVITTTTSSTGSSGSSDTTLELNINLACFPQCPIILRALLTNSQGSPIAGMPVLFRVNTTFGVMKLGSVYTDGNGTAPMNYSRSTPGRLEVVATFPGGAGYKKSTISEVKQLPEVTGEPSSQPLTLKDAAVFLVIAAVAGLWAHFAFALYQVRGISKEGSGGKKTSFHGPNEKQC